MKKLIQTAVFLCLIATAMGFRVHAVVVDDLYSTTVPVADKSESLREQAIREGLGDVLVKLTGSGAVLSDGGVADVLNQAEQYVVEYGYRDRTDGSLLDGASDSPESAKGDMATSMELNVSFETRAVQTVLRDLFLPIWPADRAVVMIWLVTNSPEGKQFVESADNGSVSADVEAALKRRGLPYKSPLYDLEDRMALSPEQAWLGNEAKLGEASRRYGIDHWLVLRVPGEADNQSGSGYQSRWFMGGGGESLSGNSSGQSKVHLLNDSVAQAVDQFSLAFTYQASRFAKTVHLLISDVDDYRDFSAVTTLLNSLEVVESAQVTRVEQDQLYLEVTTEGDTQLLISTLNSHSHFSHVVDIGDGSDQALHRYQWRAGNQ